MSQNYWYPPGSSSAGTITADQGAPTSNPNAWPVKVTDGTDVAQVSAAGALIVDASASTQPVSGTVTANQGTNPWTVAGTVTANQGTNPWIVNGSGFTQPVSAASLPLPTGASTEATLSTLNGKVPSNLTVTSTRLLVDGSGVTQPISAASLPLPTGAATAAKQPALGTAGSASADVITVQGIASMTALKVDGSAVTQPVSAASLPLPTGAATEATLSAINGKMSALGQNTMANSMPVAIASNQSAIPVSQSGTWTVQPGNTANTTPWLVKQVTSGTATLSNVSSSASSVTLLSSNASRLNATFYNDSTQICYVKFGTTASATSYTIQMAAGAYYELPVGSIYTGRIDAIWASANGNMRVTELT